MKNRKFIVVAFLLTAVLMLGVGYAAFTDTLTIIGNAHIDLAQAESAYDAKIKFIDAEATSTTGTGTTADVVSFSEDDATFTANKLAILGEKSVFTFTVQNESNVPVKITAEPKKLSGDTNPSNSNTEYFSVTYEYGNADQTIASGGTMTVTVTVEVIKAVTIATSGTFGMELTATTVDQ